MGHNWDEKEDETLRQLVNTHGKQWALIASYIPGRTASQVAARWEKCIDPSITKGPFSAEEDSMILDFVSKNGPRSWPRITQIIPQRSSKQCRERWFNHLDPNVSKVAWTPEEDQRIFDQHQKLGGKWSIIAKMLPGRTDNAIKNRWNSSISKRIHIDDKGNDVLLPDSSKRAHKTSKAQKERPPPIMTSNQTNKPPPIEIPDSNASPLPNQEQSLISPTQIPFTPFAFNTPNIPQPEGTLFSPTSPIPGFQVTPGAFGNLMSPTTPNASFLMSPSKPEFDGNSFK